MADGPLEIGKVKNKMKYERSIMNHPQNPRPASYASAESGSEEPERDDYSHVRFLGNRRASVEQETGGALLVLPATRQLSASNESPHFCETNQVQRQPSTSSAVRERARGAPVPTADRGARTGPPKRSRGNRELGHVDSNRVRLIALRRLGLHQTRLLVGVLLFAVTRRAL